MGLRLLLHLVDVALLASLVIVPAAWLVRPLVLTVGPWRPAVQWNAAFLLVPVVLLLLQGVMRRRAGHKGLTKYPFYTNACLALAATFFTLFGIEQFLRLIHYEPQLPPIVIVGQRESDTKSEGLFLEDAQLLYRFRPGAEFNGRTVNRLGFLDRDVDPAKKPGTVRVICMGDSVTGQGIPPYSGYLNTKLAAAPPGGRPWEAFNMGVHGYSAVQGLRLFELRARELQPDFVVIMYGWNDHWLSSQRDSERMVRAVGAEWGALYGILRPRLFGQLLISLSTRRDPVKGQGDPGVRVPPREYRQTLATFVAEVRDADATPILMTAPRAEKLARALVNRGNAESVEAAIRVHDEYNGIVREVAAATGAPLIDLAEQLAGDRHARLFSADGIHFNSQEGIARIADAVYRKIDEIAGGR